MNLYVINNQADQAENVIFQYKFYRIHSYKTVVELNGEEILPGWSLSCLI